MTHSIPFSDDFVYQYNDFTVAFAFDPTILEEPKRFKRLVRFKRRLVHLVSRIPLGVWLLLVVGLTVNSAWVAFYPERIIAFLICGTLAAVGVILAKSKGKLPATLGLFSALLALFSYGLLLLAGWIPIFSRAIAIDYARKHGVVTDVFDDGPSVDINRLSQSILGRNLICGDIITIKGPVEAFPPTVFRDLALPTNTPLQILPGSESQEDFSDNYRAIGTHSPVLNTALINSATLRSLAKKGIEANLVYFDHEITDEHVEFLKSQRVKVNVVRMFRAQPESIWKLRKLVGYRNLGQVYLGDCVVDPMAADVLRSLEASVIIDTTYTAGDDKLSVAQLKALADAKVNVEQITTQSIRGDQAEQLARLPSLQFLNSKLVDDAAVQFMRGCKLDSIYIVNLTDVAADALCQYPKLNYFYADESHGSAGPAAKLHATPTIVTIGIQRFAGPDAEIKKLRKLQRVSVGKILRTNPEDDK